MITSNVIRAVQEVLQKRGVEQKPNEPLDDYVARGLNISEAKAKAFLEYVHDGAPPEEAQEKAGIDIEDTGRPLLIEIARAIGTALGRIAR